MIVTKAAATVTPAESDDPNGGFDVILSTDALDRDGENLHPGEWKTPLPGHITFDSDHGMSVETTVGSGKPFLNDAGQLQVRGTFASTVHAQNVRTLVNEGHIRSVSVAFIETKSKGEGTKAPRVRELLNGAFVAVPANPEAVVLSSKSLTRQIVEETLECLGVKDADKPYGDVAYADPGYQDDGKKRYPLDSEEHCRAAWSYINQQGNAAKYSPEELSRIKSRIRAAAEKYGIEIADEKALKTSGQQAGTPQGSAEESTAAPAETEQVSAAAAADESADAAVERAKMLALTLRATALGATTPTSER